MREERYERERGEISRGEMRYMRERGDIYIYERDEREMRER